MISRKFHSTSHAKLAVFLVLMFPVALTANQNQNTASSSNSNASSPKTESKIDESKEAIYKTADVSKKARVLKFKQPSYTERAEQNETQGNVRLRVILHKSGEVRDIQVLNGLPNGLTDEAIKLAKAIQFTPAMKNGRPVSQYAILTFPFRVGF